LFYRFANFFKRKTLSCLTIIQKQKLFILELSLKIQIFFRYKISQIGKTTFTADVQNPFCQNKPKVPSTKDVRTKSTKLTPSPLSHLVRADTP